MTDQATGAPATIVPAVMVVNADDWPSTAAMIERHTGQPPASNLESLAAFVGGCVGTLVDADTAHNGGILRGRFSDTVIGQLIRFGGQLAGRAVQSISMQLLGASPNVQVPTVRVRVVAVTMAPGGQPERHDGFWDIQLGTANVVIGAARCPGCGAGLPQGSLVCPYCHADSRQMAEVPLLVVRLERLS